MIHTKHIVMILLSCIFLVSTLCTASDSTETRDWQYGFCEVMKKMMSTLPDTSLVNAELEVLKSQASSLDYMVAVPALLDIWLRNDLSEGFWWEKNERVFRTFFVAIYLCASDEGVSWVPSFEEHTSRFNKLEATQRMEEIVFVKRHRSAIAKMIKTIYEKRGIEKSGNRYSSYKRMVSKNIGSRLECR